jgi:hypothetical protein
MAESGVNIINGTDNRSRSPSPTRSPSTPTGEQKEKRFLNGWSKEQERLMADWSDLAMCYRWLHDKSEKFYHSKNLWISLPVIILSTLGGTANFGIQSLFSDDTSKKYASFAIGGVSLAAGLLTTIGNYLRYAQLEESHRVASIAWGKFQRLIAVELALKPDDRIDSLDFLKICRADLDRLIEQSPPIPEYAISLFEEEFGMIKDLKKPDICGALEHTRVFESSETRLKQVAADAALLIKHKKNTLSEFLSPKIQQTIKQQVDERIMEAIDERKKKLEEEIELQKVTSKNGQEEMQRLFDERQKRIQEEINIEKSKITIKDSTLPPPPMRRRASHFESRLQFKQNPLFVKKESAPPSPVLKSEVIQIPEASDITDLSQEKLSPVSSLTNIVVVPQDSI